MVTRTSTPTSTPAPVPASIPATQSQILATFDQILSTQASHSSVATKAEEAEQQKNRLALDTASQYSTDGIVRGLADLQLTFGAAVVDLSTQLSTENDKLESLQRAIAFQTNRLDTLRQTRVIADALHIYRQEHQATLQQLEADYERDREALEQDMATVRRQWEQEQEQWLEQQEEAEALKAAQRSRQAADQTYESEREQRLALDEYDAARREQERQIAQTQQQREQDWTEREAVLAEQLDTLAEYHRQVEEEPESLEEAVQAAREESIRDVNRQARTKAELAEKEWEGIQQGYELQVSAIEQKIERQTEQITDLSEQLQAAMAQAQSLALRAFETSSNQISQA